ncbi:Uu.00g102620.m01.CDS01 [Anthostomella pinea]|uniref:Uu.00g102620.m01.CDS01 n=1 Tax=Anthostomella pinea TaxID=933095 RepID=A0AAI8VDX6_9PEZI|nr:Uu.00g102620.m01.CDS01 [Anthostomella pinea]
MAASTGWTGTAPLDEAPETSSRAGPCGGARVPNIDHRHSEVCLGLASLRSSVPSEPATPACSSGETLEDGIEPGDLGVAEALGPVSSHNGEAPMTAAESPLATGHPDPESVGGVLESQQHTEATLARVADPLGHSADQQEMRKLSGDAECSDPEETGSCIRSSCQEQEHVAVTRDQAQNVVSDTTSPPYTSRQKQKQRAEPEQQSEPGSSQSRPRPPEDEPLAGGPPPFQPLRYGEPGWHRSADRPPKKFPIRFKDAIGRSYAFSWEKANTWGGMERLIRSCFTHVDIIGPYVFEGCYDLIVALPPSMDPYMPFAAQTTTVLNTPTPLVTPLSPGSEAVPVAGSSSTGSTIPPAPTPPEVVFPSVFAPAPGPPVQETPRIVILPELWEDMIEPGMFVEQHLWPFPQLQQEASQGIHPSPGTAGVPPPPPPPMPGGGGGVWARGGGRGGGGGRGRGRGNFVGGGAMEPVIIIPAVVRRPRGKTRKRQDGL